jgi:hypothetical protein
MRGGFQVQGQQPRAVVDLRPYCFGLTLPPLAVTLVPNVNNRKPSSLMLIAALISLSYGRGDSHLSI